MQRKFGSAAAFAFYGQLLSTKGQIDGLKALDIAAKTSAKAGVSRAELEQIADSDEVREAMRAHMNVAANLGLSATPSYVLGNTGVLGHPGVKSLAKMIAAVRRCDQIACG